MDVGDTGAMLFNLSQQRCFHSKHTEAMDIIVINLGDNITSSLKNVTVQLDSHPSGIISKL
jgi:hypothetical protein